METIAIERAERRSHVAGVVSAERPDGGRGHVRCLPAPGRPVLPSGFLRMLLLLLIAWGAAISARAQTMDDRLRLVDDINTSIATGERYVVRSGGGFVKFRGMNGECDSVRLFEPTPSAKRGDGSRTADIRMPRAIRISHTPGYVTLCVDLTLSHTREVPIDSHPLVSALNDWLDAVYAMDVQGLDGIGSLPFFTSCASTVAAVPAYEMPWGSGFPSSYLTTLKDASGASDILSTSYDILGTPKVGSSFLHFFPTNPSFLVDRVGGVARLDRQSLTIDILDRPGGACTLTTSAAIGSAACGTVAGDGAFRVKSAWTSDNPDVTWSCRQNKTFTAVDGNGNPDMPQRARDLAAYYLNDNTFTSNYGRFGNDASGYLTFTYFNNGDIESGPCSTRIMQILTDIVPGDQCCMTFPEGGTFQIDTLTGQIIYKLNGGCGECCKIPFSCLILCEPVAGHEEMLGVIDDFAQTYADVWPYSFTEYGLPTGVFPLSSHELGIRGKWRPVKNSLYKSDVLSGNSSGRSYRDAGVFTQFRLFNWKVEKANDLTRWLKRDSVTAYAPFGEVVGQLDALGVPSTAKFAHRNTVPRLIARNAEYGTVEFKSFEDDPSTLTGGAAGVVTDVAHSGRKSYHFTSPTVLVSGITINQQIKDEGLLIRFWARGTPDDPVILSQASPILGIAPADGPRKVARSGEWVLFEYSYAGSQLGLGSSVDITFSSSGWVDDIRVQPGETEMNCYVYDPNTMRLITQFDDQHFGLYYQYNGEGKLVRKIRETERGMKTIAETQYHTPDDPRDWTYGNKTQEQGGGQAGGMRADWPGAFAESGMRSDSSGPVGAGGSFDLLDVRIGPDAQSVKVLGGEHPTIPDPTELSLPDISAPKLADPFALDSTTLALPSLDRLPAGALPELEKAKVLDELRTIDERMRELGARRLDGDLSEQERAEADAALKELQKRKVSLLKEKLGMTDDDILEWYRQRKTEENE